MCNAMCRVRLMFRLILKIYQHLGGYEEGIFLYQLYRKTRSTRNDLQHNVFF